MCVLSLSIFTLLLRFFAGKHCTSKFPLIVCRPYYNYLQVIIGLVASLILLVIVIWMSHGFHPMHSKTSVTSSGVLELMWISAHSMILQNLMRTMGSSIPDQLRLRGMKAEVCLADLASKSTTCQEDDNRDTQPEFQAYAPKWQEFSIKGLFWHILSSILY